MDCARFENQLVALLGEPIDEADRRATAADLLRHAEGCETCRGSRELVEMLLLSPEERDPVTEPGEAYWASFGRRLRERIRREDEQQRRKRAWAAVGAVAALLLLALGVWTYWPGGHLSGPGLNRKGMAKQEARRGSGVQPQMTPVERGSMDVGPIIPDALDERLRNASPDALLAMGLLVGLDELWLLETPEGSEGDDWMDWDGRDDGWLFPETDDLDGEGRQALLEWIREQEGQPRGGQA